MEVRCKSQVLLCCSACTLLLGHARKVRPAVLAAEHHASPAAWHTRPALTGSQVGPL